MSDALLLWPLTYLVHSTLMLGVAWIASRSIRNAALAEALWRCAFFGAFATASLQLLSQPVPAPATSASVRVNPAAAAANAIAPPVLAHVRPPEPAVLRTAPVPSAMPLAAPVDPAWRWWLPQETRLALLAAALAWAAVAAAALVALVVQWAALARACARLRPNDDSGWAQSVRRLARHYGLKHTPALRFGATWASPLVGPRGVVCLPDWCLAQLQGAQRDAVLAHELAHLSRHDPTWRVASRVAASLGWMQPLNLVALRRLDALAEQSCDARAARAIADRHAVAEALYACARQLHAGRHSHRLQVGMATTRSPLLRRIEGLVHGDPAHEARRVSRVTWALLALLLAGGAALLPALKVHGRELRGSDWLQLLRDSMSDARVHVAVRSPGDDIDLWIKDRATLRDDSDELKSGQVTLRETADGVTRRLEVDADSGATAMRRYQLDGVPHPIDGDAQHWAERRWQMVMGALLNPEQRVDRLLQRGGPDLVMQAIENPVDIGTQHAFIEAYAGHRTLDEATVQRLILAVDRTEPAGDDHDRVLSLRDIARRQQLGPEQKKQYLNALASRRADGDSVAALQALIMQLDAQTQRDMIEATAEALRGLPSDWARTEALKGALDGGVAAAPELALQVAPVFVSDNDHRELLEHLVRRLAASDNDEMVQRYAESAHRLGSTNDRRAALVALIESVPLKPGGCMAVLDAADGINAPSDLSAVLIALAKRMPPEARLFARYRQVARVLPAFERGQVEQALDALPQPS